MICPNCEEEFSIEEMDEFLKQIAEEDKEEDLREYFKEKCAKDIEALYKMPLILYLLYNNNGYILCVGILLAVFIDEWIMAPALVISLIIYGLKNRAENKAKLKEEELFQNFKKSNFRP